MSEMKIVSGPRCDPDRGTCQGADPYVQVAQDDGLPPGPATSAPRIGELWSYPQSRTFAELLIDCWEDRTLRAVLVGMLREDERQRERTRPLAPHRSAPHGGPAVVAGHPLRRTRRISRSSRSRRLSA